MNSSVTRRTFLKGSAATAALAATGAGVCSLGAWQAEAAHAEGSYERKEGAGNCGEVLPEFLEFCEQDTLIRLSTPFFTEIFPANAILVTPSFTRRLSFLKIWLLFILIVEDTIFRNDLN